METIAVSSWEDLQSKVRELIALENCKKAAQRSYFSDLLFRGQSDASWGLKTTLERCYSKEVSERQYHRIIEELKIEVATVLQVDLLDDGRLEENSDYGPPQNYPSMIYARHHGFPSSLLDWTRSWYVALYFAISHAKEAESGEAALYAFREHCGNGKSNQLDRPHIIGYGPSVRTHYRHYQQQAEYTICRYENGNGVFAYASHDEAFQDNSVDQDALWKFTIPWSEKTKIMEELNSMNINAFTLFGSADSLMEALSYRLLTRGRR